MMFFMVFFTLICVIKGSNFDFESPEKLQLVRQTNSPASQRWNEELTRLQRSRRNSAVLDDPVVTLNAAWMIYEDGEREPLMKLIASEGFNGNSLILNDRTLLDRAIMKEDVDLVEHVLMIPGIDVNFSPNSVFHPVELAFNNRRILELILKEAKNLNLLKRNVFGSNPIKSAIHDGQFGIADLLLRAARDGWGQLSYKERDELIDLSGDLMRARGLAVDKEFGPGLKIKTD